MGGREAAFNCPHQLCVPMGTERLGSGVMVGMVVPACWGLFTPVGPQYTACLSGVGRVSGLGTAGIQAAMVGVYAPPI